MTRAGEWKLVETTRKRRTAAALLALRGRVPR